MTLFERISRHAYIFAIAVFAVTLIVYIRTLMPSTVGGDAGELQYAAPLLALVHPTGQPLYVLLGKLWTTILPIGTPAYEMNLLSATSTALGCGFVVWFLYRVYENLPVAIVSGVILGFGATIWGQAVIADKYGFNVLLATLIVGLTLWWDRDYDKPHGDKLLYVLCGAFAIGLLHHRSLLLFAVGIGILVIYRLQACLWQNWRRTLLCVVIVFLPALLVYPTVLPWLESRQLTPLLWQPDSASGWVDFLLERHVLSTEALVFDTGITDQLEIYLDTVINDYTIAILPIALIGFIAMIQRSFGAFVFLSVSYALQAILSANFRGNDRQFTYYLPSFVVLIYATGYGLVFLWSIIKARLQPDNTQTTSKLYFAVATIATVLILIIPAMQFMDNYNARRVESLYGEPLDLWRETLKSGDMGDRLTAGVPYLPENAVLASDWEQVTILWYNQQVANVRPDIEILYPIERYADFADDTEREICITRNVTIGEEWHPSNIGALICLNREPQFTAPANITSVNIPLLRDDSPFIELLGYQMDGTVFSAGAHIPLSIVWRALGDLDTNYSISLRVFDSADTVTWSQDIQSPVMGLYPMSRWVEDEIVVDYHELSLPRTTPSGQYRWAVVIYRQVDDGSFVSLRNAEGHDNIIGGTFEITEG